MKREEEGGPLVPQCFQVADRGSQRGVRQLGGNQRKA